MNYSYNYRWQYQLETTGKKTLIYTWQKRRFVEIAYKETHKNQQTPVESQMGIYRSLRRLIGVCGQSGRQEFGLI